MNIFLVNRYFYPDQSATSRMISSLAFALVAAGWKVHVITSRQLYDHPASDLPAHDSARGVLVHRVPGLRFGRMRLFGRLLDYLSFYVMAAWQLWRLAARNDVVVAGTDPPLFSIGAALVSRLSGLRLINWLQDLFPEVASATYIKGVGFWLSASLRALRDVSLISAEVNVVPGGNMAAYLARRGVPAERICVRHNWSDGNEVRPVPPHQNTLRREWQLTDKFVVGYSGNMGRAHDFWSIVAAATALAGEPDVVFVLIGDGYNRTWLEQQVRQRNLSNVLLKPYQLETRLSESLSLPDLHLVCLKPELEGFVVPSKFYGAAAAGRGVLFIGNPDGEVGQIVAAGSCGATVAPWDHLALRDWILRMKYAPDACAAWGRNARKVFEEQFDQKVAFAGWHEILIGTELQLAAAPRRKPLRGQPSLEVH